MTKLLRPLTKTSAAACLLWAVFASPLLHAQDAATPPPAAPAPAAAPATGPSPSLEQRVQILEAYLTNSDPSAALKTGPKDNAGNATIPDGLLANSPTAANSGPGHNAWMMTSAALVLFMTLPGLALFYGGLVRKKNVLSVCAQCLGCAGMVTILWWAFGYSLVFGKSFDGSALGPFLGGTEHFFLKGVSSAPNGDYSFWVSENVFSMYQLMFAIITPALIVGAIAERMKYSAIMLFILVWMFVVYFPMAHMVWGSTGLMNGTFNVKASIHALDFAGGTVVHMTSGWSALVLCLILGKRVGFGKENFAPHSLVLCMVGTGMLWVGWYGFNAGSAVAADGIAANAFMTTTLAAAAAGFFWAVIELIHKGHASILGFCSGIVAGLVVITPACGYVNATGAMIIGLLAAVVPYIFVVFVKKKFGYDDALDTFGVHAAGGTLGAIVTGLLAVQSKFADGKPNPDAVNGNLASNIDAFINNHTLVLEQLKGVALTLALSAAATVVIAFALKATLGLRPTPEDETQGLDLTDHQEEGYLL